VFVDGTLLVPPELRWGNPEEARLLGWMPNALIDYLAKKEDDKRLGGK